MYFENMNENLRKNTKFLEFCTVDILHTKSVHGALLQLAEMVIEDSRIIYEIY
jgi:hypothetical protein